MYNQKDVSSFVESKKIQYILDGSIYQKGKEIIVLAKITDVFKGVQIWAHRYKNEITSHNIIAILEETTQNIATIIGSEFGEITENLSKENRKKPKQLDTLNGFCCTYPISQS